MYSPICRMNQCLLMRKGMCPYSPWIIEISRKPSSISPPRQEQRLSLHPIPTENTGMNQLITVVTEVEKRSPLSEWGMMRGRDRGEERERGRDKEKERKRGIEGEGYPNMVNICDVSDVNQLVRP